MYSQSISKTTPVRLPYIYENELKWLKYIENKKEKLIQPTVENIAPGSCDSIVNFRFGIYVYKTRNKVIRMAIESSVLKLIIVSAICSKNTNFEFIAF